MSDVCLCLVAAYRMYQFIDRRFYSLHLIVVANQNANLYLCFVRND
jgi:hypothetical protein